MAAGFDVLTVVTMKSAIYGTQHVVRLSSLTFQRTICIHNLLLACLAYTLSLKVETVHSSEKSVAFTGLHGTPSQRITSSKQSYHH
jgi:hypothetical protein